MNISFLNTYQCLDNHEPVTVDKNVREHNNVYVAFQFYNLLENKRVTEKQKYIKHYSAGFSSS